jgi:hypothetical protein
MYKMLWHFTKSLFVSHIVSLLTIAMKTKPKQFMRVVTGFFHLSRSLSLYLCLFIPYARKTEMCSVVFASNVTLYWQYYYHQQFYFFARRLCVCVLDCLTYGQYIAYFWREICAALPSSHVKFLFVLWCVFFFFFLLSCHKFYESTMMYLYVIIYHL